MDSNVRGHSDALSLPESKNSNATDKRDLVQMELHYRDTTEHK